jgi:hypothetical protein
MSLSDCIDCWETPCVCRKGVYSFKKRVELVEDALANLSEEQVDAVLGCVLEKRTGRNKGFLQHE